MVRVHVHERLTYCVLSVLYIATGDIAVPALEALAVYGGADVVGLITGEDKKVGRKQVLTPPGIKAAAEGLGIPVLQPRKIRDSLDDIARLAPDLIVVMAYGQLLPKAVLDAPRLACLNLHGSLLPRHRGASPVQAAIASGDEESGVTLMHMAEGLDTGDIVLQHAIPIAPNETGGSLHDRLAQLAPAVLLEALPLFENGTAPRVPQDPGLATYLGKLVRSDGLLDFSKSPKELERQIRAFHPWPGTYTETAGKRLKVLPPTSVTDDGRLRLTSVQPDGKRPMSYADWLRGNPHSTLPDIIVV